MPAELDGIGLADSDCTLRSSEVYDFVQNDITGSSIAPNLQLGVWIQRKIGPVFPEEQEEEQKIFSPNSDSNVAVYIKWRGN